MNLPCVIEVGLAGLVDQLGDLAHRPVDRQVLELHVDHQAEEQAEHADDEAAQEQVAPGHAEEGDIAGRGRAARGRPRWRRRARRRRARRPPPPPRSGAVFRCGPLRSVPGREDMVPPDRMKGYIAAIRAWMHPDRLPARRGVALTGWTLGPPRRSPRRHVYRATAPDLREDPGDGITSAGKTGEGDGVLRGGRLEGRQHNARRQTPASPRWRAPPAGAGRTGRPGWSNGAS